MAMEQTPTNENEPKSELFDILNEMEERHRNSTKTLRTIEECVEGAMLLNRIFEKGIELGELEADDISYDEIRKGVEAMSITTGEKMTKSIDRHLIATYICVMRGLPVSA